MALGDVEKMVAVGLIWGATNAFMRKGAIIWDAKIKTLKPPSSSVPSEHRESSLSALGLLLNLILDSLHTYLHLILTWQYSVPLVLNLTASATFFAILGNAPISVAVPVTNATTFAVTAVVGAVLGEATRIGRAFIGFYETRVAYYSWRGAPGYRFSAIPDY